MIRVELLHLPGCPHADDARSLLRACLQELDLGSRVEEHEGDFSSPTILVNGEDVMGTPPSPVASCRLDLPTHDRVIAALKGALV